jgi:hypothetical protein
MSVKSLLRRLWTRLLRRFPWHAGSVPHDDLAHRTGWLDCFAVRVARRTPAFRPLLEDLEGRLAPATFNLVAGVTDNQPGSLRAAILAADTNASTSNTIKLGAGPFSLTDTTDGNLLIDDVELDSDVGFKTLTIVGQGETKTIVTGGTNWSDRVFEVVGQQGAFMTVVFKNLTIEGGKATGGGVLGGSDALGGGLLIDDAKVTLSNVNVQGNVALGHNGSVGIGGDGNSAFGGGIYLASGTLTLRGGTLSGNVAQAGNGGTGSVGGNGASGPQGATGPQGVQGKQGAAGAGGSLFHGNGHNGGQGGTGGPGGKGGPGGGPGGIGRQGGKGGNGGAGFGGGIYVASGQVSLSTTAITDNAALGGAGGKGGQGGLGGNGGQGGQGGRGGEGGTGGSGGEGFNASNWGTGGRGGQGGTGGQGGLGGNGGQGGQGGPGGQGGTGGNASGGGIAVATGSITLTTCTLVDNQAAAALGGVGGKRGSGGPGGRPGDPGRGGQGGPGGFGVVSVTANNAVAKGRGPTGHSGPVGPAGTTGQFGHAGVSGNGGPGGTGGDAVGAGIWVAQGAGVKVLLTGTSVYGSATAGGGGKGAPGHGGNGAAGAAGTASPAPILGAFSPGKQLVVTIQPPGQLFSRTTASVFANTGFTVVVKVVDSSGNVITSFNGTVKIGLAANPGNDHLSGTLTVKAVNGVATFSSLELHKIANGYRLKVSATGAVSTVTEPFDVVAKTELLVTTQPPASIVANREFGVIAELVDSSGNVITSFNGPVTISLAANPGNDHLSGTLTVKAVKGVATFAPLELHRIGNGYKLKVSATGAVSALTEPFRVVGLFTPPP